MGDARRYVVTGSASGIGAALVAAIRDEGHGVVTIDLHDADVCVDLATADGRRDLVSAVGDASGGRVDAVVACAGVSGDLSIAVNYFGMVATLDGLRLLLEGSTSPRAVAVTSLASVMPTDPELVELCLAGDEAAALARGAGDYPSSKAAMCRWIRRHAPTPAWAGAGIALNAVAPGTVVTPMTAPFLATPEGTAALDAMVPMPLNGHARPEQLAPLLLFLAGPSNTHVTGQVVFADGGADAVLRGDTVW
jgi:NAD(P)-dependent dehydrogenase (short-subunit alcohol dehydrogenase family)